MKTKKAGRRASTSARLQLVEELGLKAYRARIVEMANRALAPRFPEVVHAGLMRLARAGKFHEEMLPWLAREHGVKISRTQLTAYFRRSVDESRAKNRALIRDCLAKTRDHDLEALGGLIARARSSAAELAGAGLYEEAAATDRLAKAMDRVSVEYGGGAAQAAKPVARHTGHVAKDRGSSRGR